MPDGLLQQHPDDPAREVADLPSPRIQAHAANLMVLGDGALACVWFGGSMEGRSDISVFMSRLAPGAQQWSEPVQLSHDTERSEQNPVLFPAPDTPLMRSTPPAGTLTETPRRSSVSRSEPAGRQVRSAISIERGGTPLGPDQVERTAPSKCSAQGQRKGSAAADGPLRLPFGQRLVGLASVTAAGQGEDAHIGVQASFAVQVIKRWQQLVQGQVARTTEDQHVAGDAQGKTPTRCGRPLHATCVCSKEAVKRSGAPLCRKVRSANWQPLGCARARAM